MARSVIVTGYVPIAGHPRSAKEYGDLGEGTLGVLDAPVLPFYDKVEDTWLFNMVRKRALPVSHSVADNPAKNSLAYHYVQHQKFAWLVKAAVIDKTVETFVWIDYGIGHVPGVTAAVIDEFMVRVQPDDFAIPGCWPKDSPYCTDDKSPCWRFCGGVMVVPRSLLLPLYLRVVHNVKTQLAKTGNISWEVNTLARMEPDMKRKPRWYLADHNETLFTNYGDGLCSPALSQVSADQSVPTSTLH